MERPLNEVLATIAARLDPDEIVEVLGITSEQLVKYLEPEIEDLLYRFSEILSEDDDEEENETE